MSTMEERFWAKVNKAGPLWNGTPCWSWTGSLATYGYGQLRKSRKKQLYAHRFSYELAHGEIPPGLEPDHLCRNRACVNPSHMEVVTRLENIRRGFSPPAIHARKTLCVHGHSLDIVRPKGGRDCRVCKKERDRRCYESIKADPIRKAAKLNRDNTNRKKRVNALSAALGIEVAP